MTDEQISELERLLTRPRAAIYWYDSYKGVHRRVLRVERDYLDPEDARFGDTTREDIARLADHKYISLVNIPASEIVRIKASRVFP